MSPHDLGEIRPSADICVQLFASHLMAVEESHCDSIMDLCSSVEEDVKCFERCVSPMQIGIDVNLV